MYTRLENNFFPELLAKDLTDTAVVTHCDVIGWLYAEERACCTIPCSSLRLVASSDAYQDAATELVRAGVWEKVGNNYVVVHHADVVSSTINSYHSKLRRDRSAKSARRAPAAQVLMAAIAAGTEACAVCGTVEHLQIDHIVPRSRGGSDEPENLQVLCIQCNSSKNNRDWDEWRATR